MFGAYHDDMRRARGRIGAAGSARLRTRFGVVEYVERGVGVPLLVSHGVLGCHVDGVDGYWSTLPGPGFQVIAPARFGYFGSALPDGATPADQADAYELLLDHLGIDRAVVVGYSAGSGSVLEFARRHRDRVVALILASARLGGGVTLSRRLEPVLRLAYGSDLLFWIFKKVLPTAYSRMMGAPTGYRLTPAEAHTLAGYRELLFPFKPRRDGAIFDGFVSNLYADRFPLQDLTVPTLVISAVDDPLAPYRFAADAADRIPSARMLTIERGGHLFLGHDRQVREQIAAFLKDVASPAALVPPASHPTAQGVSVMVTETSNGTMRGRTVLVTGATDGIGLHTARALAGLGAHVIITGRTEARGLAAVEDIDAATGRRSATFIQADHSTVGGNRRLADRVRADFAGLDVLVNNVGGLYDTRRQTTDGYEATLAMNFLGPFALTTQLLPALREHAPARCVFVVSAGFKMYRRDPFDDVQSTRDYVAADAYNRAKLLNLLAGLALAERLAADRITVTAVHPGVAWTQMTRSMTPRTMPLFRYIWPIVRLAQRHGSPQKAGQRVAHLASSAQLAGFTGAYFEAGSVPKKLSPRELNVDNQQRAWRLATDLIAAVAPQVVDGG